MKKKFKKLTSVCLAVIMVLSILTIAPISVSAAGNSMGTATSYTLGSSVSGNIKNSNQNDFYKFTLPSSGRIIINVKANREYSGYFLFDSNGNEVFKNNNCRWNSTSKVMSISMTIDLTSGEYVFCVGADWYENSTGSYNFNINFSSSYETFKETGYGQNNSMKNASQISLNKLYYGHIAQNDDSDFYSFTLSNTQNIIININSYIPGVNYYIFNANGEEVWNGNSPGYIATFWNEASESAAVNEKINLLSGTYYFTTKKLRQYTGNYNFKISQSITPTSIRLSQTSLTLGAGESYTLTKSVSPSNASTSYTWSSSNTYAATVNSNGYVYAKNPGTATITVKTSNGKTATCKVTVKPAPSSVKTNPTSLTLGKGESYTISESTNSGSYANASNLKWSTSNSSVATVTKGSGNKAKITAKGVGTAYIKITLYNGKTAQCKVTVKSAPSSVKANPTSLTLGKGENYTISESTNSGSYANAANLKWSTSNSSVATVTKGSGNKAKITAKGVGTAYIKITLYNGKTAQCKVTVKNAPSSVKTNPTSLTLRKGGTYTISESTNSGSYANAANLKWSTSNSKVATVTKGSGNKAKITAKGVGTAYIKITLYNGKTAQCKVTVK